MPRQIEKLHFGKSTTGVTISETELQKIEKINELIEVVNEQSVEINRIKNRINYLTSTSPLKSTRISYDL